MTLATSPIGVFDSGIGGLSVLQALRHELPHEHFVYLADSGNAPYGERGDAFVTARTHAIAQYLCAQHAIKALVIACNTATSAALEAMREQFAPLPVMGVVAPGAQAAAQASTNGHIVVVATEATIAGGAYQHAIARIRPEAIVTGRACTLFVPLAEEGWMNGPIVEGVASRYLADIFSHDRTGNTEDSGGNRNNSTAPDTLLLGCTHFPLLQEALQNVVGPQVRIVDSAATTALRVAEELKATNLLRQDNGPARYSFLTTDNTARFARTGSLFLGRELGNGEVSLVDL